MAKPIEFAVLTRQNARYGIELLERLECRGLHPACIGVEQTTWSARIRMARFLAKKTGIVNAAWHNGRIWSRLLRARALGRTVDHDYARYGADVLAVPEINCEAMRAFLLARGVDLVVLGQSGIVRRRLLEVPATGTLNCHPGRLPRWRGVDTVKWALLAGERPGVSLHWVDAGVDTGRIIEVRDVEVRPDDSLESVEARAVEGSLDLLVEGVQRVVAGDAPPGAPQERGQGRQTYLMPPWTLRRLRRGWPELRRGLSEGG